MSPQELAILADLPRAARHYQADAELRSQGAVQPPGLLLSGWAYSHLTSRDGRRQIIRFLLPGDAIGTLSHPTLPASSTVLALTPAAVADGRALLRIGREESVLSAGLKKAVAMMAHAEEIELQNHVVRLGRRTAYERLVHLLWELYTRLQAVDMTQGNGFVLPLTQEMLGDALGLSVVHINRTLQQIRRDKLLEMRSGQVTLLQPDLMRKVADS